MEEKHKLLPWKTFLGWECLRCGLCCSTLRVRLLDEEVNKYKKRYGDVIEYIDGKPFLKHKKNGGCIFLEYKNNLAVCKIYEDRPLACRIYPFYSRRWREAKSSLSQKILSESEFKYRGRKFAVFVSNLCPGLGRGPLIEEGIRKALREKYFRKDSR